MIGSHVSAKLSMPFQNEPPSLEDTMSAGCGSKRMASVPPSRDRTRELASKRQPSGRSAPGARSASRTVSLASPQFSSDVSRTVSW